MHGNGEADVRVTARRDYEKNVRLQLQIAKRTLKLNKKNNRKKKKSLRLVRVKVEKRHVNYTRTINFCVYQVYHPKCRHLPFSIIITMINKINNNNNNSNNNMNCCRILVKRDQVNVMCTPVNDLVLI